MSFGFPFYPQIVINDLDYEVNFSAAAEISKFKTKQVIVRFQFIF